ncbi:hypothetical protein GCM10012288_03350 [Malaciobacter pacificus]|uniref:Periplasmic monoheme cytochrome c553 n=1 Tax=Malaciobacter pacificus TaxID=1080223 RepID=A0A5C2H918_9BACT|nr:c-type cytochrome [Malaciobacter pacificus]QEP33716.1 periplasmic monoheme cytochrome c553 [Malaciobacter pacificus]GGD32749.1 hypothetical protein GCM10012288_03350 [Malaciobacter pacificus]
MKKLVLTTVIAASCAFAAPASYNTCKGCHGAKGEMNTTTGGKSHIPADLTKAQVIEALNGYKAGNYANAGKMKMLMKGQVARLSDEQIKELAEYIGK